jgi:hypothetical protein
MSTAEMIERIGDVSPRLRARFVGVYYVLTILTGAFILFFRGRLVFVADVIVTVFYIAATVLLYFSSKRALSKQARSRMA